MSDYKPYEDMLYPQCQFAYDKKPDKTITKDVWDWLQQQALDKLNGSEWVHDKVRKHWSSIVHGTIPFGYKLRGETHA